MNDTLQKIQLALTAITLLILIAIVYVARGVEAELRKSQIALHNQMGVFEKKLDIIAQATAPKRR